MIDEVPLLDKIKTLKERARKFLSRTITHHDYNHGLVNGEWAMLNLIEKEIEKLKSSVVKDSEKF